MALVLHCDCAIISLEESDPTGIVRNVKSLPNGAPLIVLKMDSIKPHNLKHWNENLMLVSNIEVVESPKSRIPALVGFNRIPNKSNDRIRDLLSL